MAVDLAIIEHAPEGAETLPPLVIAHGLFGAGRNFDRIGRALATGRRVVLADMRNHGASPWTETMSYPEMAGDLAALIRARGGRAAVMGHSMGGKAAMALALAEPQMVDRLVVADIAPVAYGHSHSGYLAAMAGVDLTGVTRRGAVDPMLADAVPEAPLRAFLLQNLVFEDGRARWRLNLDVLAREMGRLTGWDVPPGRYEGPALFLRGGASPYVEDAHRPAIEALFPKAEIRTLEGLGHWLHAEAPERFLEAVGDWLAR